MDDPNKHSVAYYKNGTPDVQREFEAIEGILDSIAMRGSYSENDVRDIMEIHYWGE